jgi:hypothetical protein
MLSLCLRLKLIINALTRRDNPSMPDCLLISLHKIVLKYKISFRWINPFLTKHINVFKTNKIKVFSINSIKPLNHNSSNKFNI